MSRLSISASQRTRYIRQVTIRAVSLGVLVALVTGCGKAPPSSAGPASPRAEATTDKGTAPKTDQGGEKGAAPSAKADAADFTMAAADFEKEWVKDKEAARAKYKGKTIELSGTVGRVAPTGLDPGMTIHFRKGVSETLAIWCSTDEPIPLDSLAKGQSVRIRGQLGFNEIEHAVVVEKGPDTAIRATAEELAKEYTGNPKKTVEKCEWKTVVVSGEIAATGKNITLKGDGMTAVECLFGSTRAEQAIQDKLKVGDKVTLVGSWGAGGKGSILLNDCRVVAGK